tara:strand:+ start:3899 stop:4270 length:372 start_codon:yes stop_codon:yes gene_type:complete
MIKKSLPEKKIYKFLKSINKNFSFQIKKLPGTPDFLMKDNKLILNVNGCYWHNHGCVHSRIPERNTNYWLSVFEKNKARDYENTKKLKALGYKIINIWECVLNDEKAKSQTFKNLERIVNGTI